MIADSVADRVAERYAVPHADRDVFLDNDEDGAAVTERLVDLEAVARKHGMAIAIGHPHDGTIAALAEWLPSAAQKGFGSFRSRPSSSGGWKAKHAARRR